MARRDQRPANVAYYRRNREFEIARVRVRQHGTVDLLRELRERPCADCEGSFAPHQMDFDHRVGSVKSFNLTSGGAMLRPKSVLLGRGREVRHRLRELSSDPNLAAPCRTTEHPSRHFASHRAEARVLASASPDAGSHPGSALSRLRREVSTCAMDFDHRDPGSKRSAVMRMIGRAGTARMLDEVAACDIVCANCHRLRTFRRRSADPVRE
jgi:hypothetical protein